MWQHINNNDKNKTTTKMKTILNLVLFSTLSDFNLHLKSVYE